MSEFKLYESDPPLISILIPVSWEEYDDEDASDTYAFFNPDDWKGNFRITAFKRNKTVNDNSTNAMLKDELDEHPGSTLITIGIYDCVCYKDYLDDKDDELVIFYWMFGKDNCLFIASFTTNKEWEDSSKIIEEIELIKRALASAKLTA